MPLLSQFSSVQFTSLHFSGSVMSNSLRPCGLQHARPPCPSPTPGDYSNSCPLSQWYHPTISSSVIPFSPQLQSFPASGSFKWVCSSYQVAKVFEFQLQYQSSNEYAGLISFRIDWWISMQSKGFSRVFSNTTFQKHQFFDTQLSSQSNSCIHIWPLEKP